MRIDEGGLRTLEEDLLRIYNAHGWKIIKEEVKGNGRYVTWKITAKRKGE